MTRNDNDVRRFVKDELACLGVFQIVQRVGIKLNFVQRFRIHYKTFLGLKRLGTNSQGPS